MNLFNDAYAQIANDKATGNSEMNPVKNFILGRCRAETEPLFNASEDEYGSK